MSYIKYIVLLFLAAGSLQAAELLRPEDAVRKALENNYSIVIAGKQLEISQNNATAGNAGMLPGLDLTGNQKNTVTNVKQEYYDGRKTDKTGASSNTLEAAVGLNWTIFDGMSMFRRRDRLDMEKEISGLALKETIESTVSQVLNAYYDVVLQAQLLKAASENLAISRERLYLTEQKFNAGALSKLELLQAEVDLNTDVLDSLDNYTLLKNYKVKLNKLMALRDNPDFEAIDEVIYDSALDKAALVETAMKANTLLQAARKDNEAGKLDIEIYESEYYPKLSAYGGYSYSYLTSQSGMQKENTSYGWNYGLSLSFNLFNGMNTQRKIENAKIEDEISLTVIKQLESDIAGSLNVEYNNYENLLGRLRIEEQNYGAAEENMQLARERLNAGKITQVEFREIQVKYIDAGTRIARTKSKIKAGETALMYLAGRLVK